ncbi:MAG: hypothetical protein JNG84_10620 [Archangium sp.]|nr:hypothetical protein [Archangium sp.]
MPLAGEHARAVIKRLVALGGGHSVVQRAVARELSALAPSEANEFLHELQRLARTGWLPAVTVLPSVVRALEQEPELAGLADVARRVAALEERPDVEMLFTQGAPQREYDADAAARADAKLFTMPLGYLKQQARLTRNPDELARLAVASNPEVVREVLKNTRLTEAIVVRIAARRPARPEPLTEIWRSARWSGRPAVRRALVCNPYLPPEVAAKIVPLLSRAELQEIVGDNSLHVAVRRQAEVLLSVAGTVD